MSVSLSDSLLDLSRTAPPADAAVDGNDERAAVGDSANGATARSASSGVVICGSVVNAAAGGSGVDAAVGGIEVNAGASGSGVNADVTSEGGINAAVDCGGGGNATEASRSGINAEVECAGGVNAAVACGSGVNAAVASGSGANAVASDCGDNVAAGGSGLNGTTLGRRVVRNEAGGGFTVMVGGGGDVNVGASGSGGVIVRPGFSGINAGAGGANGANNGLDPYGKGLYNRNRIIIRVNSPADIDELQYAVFCDRFQFQGMNVCWVCNGFYAPNFGEPVCNICHSFLFSVPPFCGIKEVVTVISDDEDSGNDEPPYNNADKERAEPEEQELELEVPDVSENEQDDNEFDLNRPAPVAPPNINQYIDLLSQPYNADRSENNIDALPVEVLLSIFNYLDDISLWKVGEVCKRWRTILETNTAQAMWQKYTVERWPLFEPQLQSPNWFKLYGSLMSSSNCQSCLIQMALKTPLPGRGNNFRLTRLRGDIRTLDVDATEGIDALPLDMQLSYWQAFIKGPSGSPYEGGKFFLYIVIPFQYPMLPPTIRFLTKIIHPNVSRHGEVGVDIIQHNWSLALTISKLLISVQSLLTDPFTEICMEPEVGRLYANERPKFNALARSWTRKYAMLETNPPS